MTNCISARRGILAVILVPQLASALLVGITAGPTESVPVMCIAAASVAALCIADRANGLWRAFMKRRYLAREEAPLVSLVVTRDGRVERRVGAEAHVLARGERFVQYD